MQILKNLEKNISLHSSIKIENLVITPIVLDEFYHNDKIVSFDTLFDSDLAEAKEVSDEGIVSRINIINKSKNFLFITDGEAIVGAKQNRISERSVILNEVSETIIPVYCVERGRWGYRNNRDFSKSEFSISPKSRDRKAEFLKHKEDSYIQNMVWQDVDELSQKNASYSSTSDLGEVLNSKNYDYAIDEFKDIAFNGFIVSGSGRPFIEIFSDKENSKKQLNKSIKTWLADQNNVQESIIDPNSCLRQFLNSSWSIDDSIGLEKAFNADGLNNGRSIFLDDKIIHSYFYL